MGTGDDSQDSTHIVAQCVPRWWMGMPSRWGVVMLYSESLTADHSAYHIWRVCTHRAVYREYLLDLGWGLVVVLDIA